MVQVGAIMSVYFSDVRCPPLEHPIDGSVQYSSVNLGTIAEYSCNDGMTFVGVSTRACQSDGSWSGDEPHCQHGEHIL